MISRKGVAHNFMNDVLTDGDIISLFNSRNESAIEHIDRKYGKLFRHISLNILYSEEDAEECVNDAYLKLWNAIPPESPQSLKAYGARVVRNASINRAEYNDACKRRLNELCTELDQSTPDTYDPADGTELKRLLNDFLKELDRETRVMFVLRYFYGESTENIAERMETSDQAIRSKLFRTRRKLKNYLEKEGVSL